MWPYHGTVWVQGGEPLGGFWHTWSSGPVRQWNWEHSCAWEGLSHPAPPPPCAILAAMGRMDCFFPASLVLCGPWHAGHAFTTLQTVHPKRVLLITPLLSLSSQGKWGKVPAIPSLPLPSFLPSPTELCRAPPCMWSRFDMRRSSDGCLLLELWLCLSGMMQPRKNVKHLSSFTAGNSASN